MYDSVFFMCEEATQVSEGLYGGYEPDVEFLVKRFEVDGQLKAGAVIPVLAGRLTAIFCVTAFLVP